MSELWVAFFFQAEDGIRDLVRSRGLGDVYKRQVLAPIGVSSIFDLRSHHELEHHGPATLVATQGARCLLYTSDAADERSSVDLGGRRIIKKKNTEMHSMRRKTIIRETKTATAETCQTINT